MASRILFFRRQFRTGAPVGQFEQGVIAEAIVAARGVGDDAFEIAAAGGEDGAIRSREAHGANEARRALFLRHISKFTQKFGVVGAVAP